ncbi:MAG: sigma-70 family RNA polymerase sigma factor [Acidobacteria bacterium]|jgi:RNA polymerase sigma-70 factor (ECF subfamily)|nr:sigma-70 family RNA polymerase sigma factor [Acidobacteriota bacterium]
MFFSKSIAFDEEESGNVALATDASSVRSLVEAEFIEKLKAGDAKAFDLLVTRYSGDIYALLFRITEDVEEASDLTQETFLRALKAIEKFRGEADLKTWLFRIAINESRNRFRWWKRRKREKTFSLDASAGDSEMSIYETMPGNSANPEENILQMEREKVLTKALNELPQIYREAVVLCDVENLSYCEIASALNTTMGTVKSRIARGREELRRKLKDI